MKKILILTALFLFAGMTVYSQVNVKFTIDMSVWQKNGSFNPKTDTVRVAGTINNWSTSATTLTVGTGADSAKYSATVTGVTAGTAQYKFIFINSAGIQWEDNFPTSSTNREATIGTTNVILPVVFFKDITGKKNFVNFTVDMTLPISTGKVIIGSTNVYLAGTMTNWGTSPKLMTKNSKDSTYSVLVDSMFSGSIAQFKFVYNAGAFAWDNAESGFTTVSGNREWMVPEKDSSKFLAYWNDVNPNVQLGTGKVNFTLDMSVMVKAGIFNPVKDSVLISGGFNGWTTTDPTQFLTQSPINDSSYFISHQFTSEPYGSEFYKYVVKKATPKVGLDTLWADGYERPVFWGGGNRISSFKGETSRDTTDWYDNVHPDWFVPTGTAFVVTFTVDMTYAIDASLQAVPFIPAQDTLYWLSEEPAFARSQDWYRPADGHMRLLKMVHTTGNLYSGTMTLKTPTWNTFEYRYEWQKGTDASWVTESSGFDAYAYRVRYVGQDKASSFPHLPWTMPTDVWTNSGIKTQEKDPITSFTGIKKESQTPVSYSLSQNYPNPFNPSTTIKFSLTKADVVVLKVYNVLGQQVVTLINEKLNPGSYDFKFDASKLSSGIYFYNLTSGQFNQTKKMILLK
jgi:hypothetical protein